MRIVRAPRRRGFLIVPNATVRDSTISRRARGLLVEILSYPDDWSTTSEDLADGGPEGRDAIRTALSELEGAGYLLRARVVGPGGRWSTVSAVFDTPQEPGSLPPGVERVGGRLRLVPLEEEPFDVDADENAKVPPTPRNPASAEPAPAGQALSRKTVDEDPPTPRQRGNWCARHPEGAPDGVSCRACGTDRASRARAAASAAAAARSAAAHARAAARTSLADERDPDLSETWAARVKAENRWTG